MVSPALGTVIGVASTLTPQFRTFFLKNLDTGEELQGQWEAQEVSEQITSNWAEFTALNRQNPIVQFLNGGNDRLSFNARFYQDSILGDPILGTGNLQLGSGPLEKLKKLKEFARIDPKVRRPPIFGFQRWRRPHSDDRRHHGAFRYQLRPPGFLRRIQGRHRQRWADAVRAFQY